MQFNFQWQERVRGGFFPLPGVCTHGPHVRPTLCVCVCTHTHTLVTLLRVTMADLLVQQLVCCKCERGVEMPWVGCPRGHLVCNACRPHSLPEPTMLYPCPVVNCGPWREPQQHLEALEQLALALPGDVRVPCPHTECAELLPLADVETHVEACPKRIIRCSECEFKATPAVMWTKHWSAEGPHAAQLHIRRITGPAASVGIIAINRATLKHQLIEFQLPSIAAPLRLLLTHFLMWEGDTISLRCSDWPFGNAQPDIKITLTIGGLDTRLQTYVLMGHTLRPMGWELSSLNLVDGGAIRSVSIDIRDAPLPLKRSAETAGLALSDDGAAAAAKAPRLEEEEKS